MGKITATSKELDDSLAEKRSKVQSPEELVYVSREIRLSIVVQLSDRQVGSRASFAAEVGIPQWTTGKVGGFDQPRAVQTSCSSVRQDRQCADQSRPSVVIQEDQGDCCYFSGVLNVSSTDAVVVVPLGTN
jgi:hypothetical protein